MKKILITLLILFTFIIKIDQTIAATVTWDANGITAGQTDGLGVWLNVGRWWNGVSNVDWVSGDDVIFGNGGTGGAVTLASPTTVNSLTLNSYTGTYTLGTAGQTITLNNGITKNSGSAGIVNIISPVILTGPQTWLNDSSGILTISSTTDNGGNLLIIDGTGRINFNGNVNAVISGSGGITKNGTGYLTLGSNPTPIHTYTGTTNINNGVLMQSANNIGPGNLTINNGVIESYWSTNFTRTLGSGAGQIQILGGESGLSLNGSTGMSVILNNNVSYEVVWGSTYFNPLKLVLQSPYAQNSSSLNFQNKIDLNGSDRTILVNPTTGTGAGSATISGVIRDSAGIAGLIKTGLGRLNLTVVNTYPGPTTVSSGELRVTGSIASTSAVSVNGGKLSGNGTVAGPVTVADNTSSTIQGGTGAGNTGTLNTGALTFGGVNAKLIVNTNGSTNSKIISSGAVNLGGVTVDILGTLPIGTYDLITGSSITGSAVIGINNTGRGVSLSVTTTKLRLIVGLVPDAPTSVLATAGNNSSTVTWQAPVSDGGSPILNYKVYENNYLASTTASNTFSFEHTDLVNGVSYSYYVTAVNIVGESASSSVIIVTPSTIPNKPNSPTLSKIYCNSVTVNWSQPFSGGSAITHYNIYKDDVLATTTDLSTFSYLSDGLSINTNYSYKVSAININGESLLSNPTSATTTSTTTAPQNVSAIPFDSAVDLSWDAPEAVDPEDIIGYNIYQDDVLTTTTGTTTEATITGLTNGTTYSFYIRAVRTLGICYPSATIQATPYTISNPPASITANAFDREVILIWIPPTFDGGSSLISYYIIDNDQSTSTALVSSLATSTTFHSLTNGLPYTFSIFAINQAGTSTATISNTVIPAGVPYTPSITTVTKAGRTATVSFSTPNDNGSAILYYTVTSSPGGFTATSTTSPISISNLNTGTDYTFTVTATNAIGESDSSTISDPIRISSGSSANQIGILNTTHNIKDNIKAGELVVDLPDIDNMSFTDYSLICPSPYPDDSLFTLDPNGKLYTKEDIEYNIKNIYDICVVATGNGTTYHEYLTLKVQKQIIQITEAETNISTTTNNQSSNTNTKIITISDFIKLLIELGIIAPEKADLAMFVLSILSM